MIDDAKVEAALDWLRDNAEKAAEARAHKEYMAEWLGVVRAQMATEYMQDGLSAAAADMKAKASQQFEKAVMAWKQAVKEDELMRWHRTRSDAVIEVWRSQQANARVMEKVR